MKISLNKQEKNKCLKLLETKFKNIQSVEYYIDYLINHCRDIKFASDTDDFFAKFNKLENIENDVIKNSTMNKITILNKHDFINDEFFKNIGKIKGAENGWKFMMLNYDPYEGFISDEIKVDDNFFAEYSPLSYFEEKFEYPAVLENDEIWMSVMPHEINTMKDPIKNAFGNVLVLGLGIGYFLFNVVMKENVTSVTVIEKDKRIISLFKKYLLPKFKNKEKIQIIEDDAIEFTKNLDKKYDYCFADIWHNVGDGELLYLKLKCNENKYPQIKFDYWIEKSLLAMIRRQTLTVFEEQLNGSSESMYLKYSNDNDRIINSIYFYLKNAEIKTFNDLHNILTDDSLKVMSKYLIKS